MKWVTSDGARGHAVIVLEQLVRNPVMALITALAAFDDHIPNSARMEAAVAQVDGEKVAHRRIRPRPGTGVHGPRDVTQFRHYDATVFGHLDKPRLTRQEVNEVFRRHLGRDVAEANMLALQTTPSVDAVERMILGSSEFAARGRKLRVV